MKVLLVHNFYGSAAPSGENQVFEIERGLLERRGVEVRTLTRNSDEIRRRGWFGTIQGALTTPWNPSSVASTRRIVAAFHPDIVHVHNTFPLISPAVFSAIPAPAARVLTLHNYRLLCPAAIPLRDGHPCTTCITSRSVVPALRHGCYRSSRMATLPLALSVALHRRLQTWTRHVDAFVALTEFQRDLMASGGIPLERLHVKPNFFPGAPTALPWAQRRHAVVFAGRLTEEKGVAFLVEAWVRWGASAPELRIVGDGPLRSTLESRVSGTPTRVRFLGRLPAPAAEKEIAAAKLVVLPSICYEGFPMVVREALAFGTPVAVADIGPLPAIVRHGETGVIFPPRDASALQDAIHRVWGDGVLERFGAAARREFETKYTEDANYARLLDIYATAICRRTGQ